MKRILSFLSLVFMCGVITTGLISVDGAFAEPSGDESLIKAGCQVLGGTYKILNSDSHHIDWACNNRTNAMNSGTADPYNEEKVACENLGGSFRTNALNSTITKWECRGGESGRINFPGSEGGSPTGAYLPGGGSTSTGECEKTFLGLRPWYSGLVHVSVDALNNKTCVPDQPDQDGLASYIWRIVLNISADLALVVGYVALIFLMYGGYKYIMSTGEPQKVSSAKQTITNALIGLVIAILATIIVNTIIAVLGNAAS